MSSGLGGSSIKDCGLYVSFSAGLMSGPLVSAASAESRVPISRSLWTTKQVVISDWIWASLDQAGRAYYAAVLSPGFGFASTLRFFH